jgi:hypothetical protein
MKKIVESLIFLLLLGVANAQTVLPKLVYDFSKGHFLDNDYVKNGKLQPMPYGSFAVVEVINVNTFRYRVEITGRGVDYVTQMPSELQAIFRQQKTNGNTAAGQQQGEAAAAQMQSVAESAKNRNNTLAADIANKRAAKALLPAQVRKVTKSGNARNIANPALAKAEQEIEALTLAQAQKEPFAEAMEKLAAACKEYVEVARKVSLIKFTRAELINVSKQDWPDHKSMEDNMPTVLGRDEMRSHFDKFTQYYAEARGLYNNALLLAEGDDKKKVEEAKKMIEEGYQKITEDNYLKLIDDVYTLQEAMAIAKSFTVTSPPVQIQGDAVAFDIKAAPVKVNDLLNHTPEKSFGVEIPTKGGLKVDFSVGPVFSFGKNAKDELYFLQPVANNADSVDLTARPNNNVLSPGIAAMMYAYARGKDTRIGGCFGVGANVENFDNVKASFYLGIGAIFGKRQKLTTSLGLGFLRVDRLKETQYSTKRYKASEIAIGNVTEKVFKGSFFLSIGYNLSTRTEIK